MTGYHSSYSVDGRQVPGRCHHRPVVHETVLRLRKALRQDAPAREGPSPSSADCSERLFDGDVEFCSGFDTLTPVVSGPECASC
jgi:hypothetical protein